MFVGSMVGFALSLLLFAAVVYAVYLVINLIPFPPQIKQIVLIIFGLLAVIFLLTIIFPVVGAPVFRWR